MGYPYQVWGWKRGFDGNYYYVLVWEGISLIKAVWKLISARSKYGCVKLESRQ